MSKSAAVQVRLGGGKTTVEFYDSAGRLLGVASAWVSAVKGTLRFELPGTRYEGKGLLAVKE